jgi:ABC-type nitrate/sulfonate/bicarbonate transport system substrate-binding protein
MNFVGKGAVDKALAKITLNVFPGGFNWPSFVAQSLGFFAANGLEVTLQPTPNSVAQMTGLSRGEFQIAMTAFDNIVAYIEGQGEAPIGPQPEFLAFMGSDSGFLSLVAQREIERWRDLKGKKLSVDARTTGYAFVLFEMLRRNGLADEG